MGGRNEQAHNRQIRRAGAVTTQRHVQSSTCLTSWSNPPENTVADIDCDMNADTCCVGKIFIVLSPTYHTADVYAYNTSMRPIKNVPIVSELRRLTTPFQGQHTFSFSTNHHIMAPS